MMKSFGVAPGEVVDNNEFLEILKERLQNGEISKQEILGILNNIPEHQAEDKSAVSSKTSLKMLRFATHGATGLEYALNGGEVIGPVIRGKNCRYVLALKNIAKNLTLEESESLARNQESVGGINWIVPNDDHFKSLIGNLQKINQFLEAYAGDKITSIPFLSATSQTNRPKQWNVRLILPLPK